MPQSTIIPKTSLLVFCKHLQSDDDAAYWFLFEEFDLLLMVCEKCTNEHLGTGGTVDTMLPWVLVVESYPSLTSQTVH